MANATSIWTIHAQQGLGPIRFGMTPEQVLQACPGMDLPLARDIEWDGSRSEFHGVDVPRLSYTDNRLTDIDCPATMQGLMFEELDVFATDARIVLQRLFMRNQNRALAGLGYVFFDALGISTQGFYDLQTNAFVSLEDAGEFNKGLALWSSPYADGLLDEFMPFHWPNP